MHLPFATLAVAATSLLASSANAFKDIPPDLPVSSLLSSARSHLSRGETNQALDYYDAAIARDPSNYLTFFKRATTYLSLGRHSQATDDFNKVLSIKPNFEGAHLQLAKIKSRVADWDGAKAQFKSGSRGPESLEVKELEGARLAATLAAAAEESEQWEECVTQAGTAILVATRSHTLRELRSRCRFKRGDIEGGIGDLQHVLNLRPGDTKPHLIISAATFYALGDQDKGLAQIRKCLHSDPDSKVCKKMLKQEKAVQKTYNKIIGQLNRGQVTTAGRSLMGTADSTGLYPDIQKQVDELMAAETLPTNARIRLLEEVVDLTCEAYSEVSSRQHAHVSLLSLTIASSRATEKPPSTASTPSTSTPTRSGACSIRARSSSRRNCSRRPSNPSTRPRRATPSSLIRSTPCCKRPSSPSSGVRLRTTIRSSTCLTTPTSAR